MMRSVHHLSTGMIGAVMFPGAMSVMLFGMLGGILVDKKGHHLVFYISTLMIIGGFLTTAMLTDQSPWIVTAISHCAPSVLIIGGRIVWMAVETSSPSPDYHVTPFISGLRSFPVACIR
ncbi:hypothetical protein [Paenibacillus sp. MDMC362]|uniref:hypothetical protein n=1 Tax=Paenibacillus sp. MDMC362 TaxID=2977365 RepID=UPI000DC2E9D7|nr:hypothetical protein [Paenibacillus sp. MDMC362]RAR45763.1 hypothetical protein DP091_01980 [Paenibacillus sp. MDMC362]